eukprot:11374539-Heterocapsa_arctica.AAC.1
MRVWWDQTHKVHLVKTKQGEATDDWDGHRPAAHVPENRKGRGKDRSRESPDVGLAPAELGGPEAVQGLPQGR